ncbi:type II toxin-antitoxin system VapC family toxin [Desulfonatronospira sp.]|uniref:type II toxin-antitoxin system VapC family toxin n=1 Tax=Desulfonatronospira sp. TaxID=1962951 RepID=UPI0025BA68BE|nr:type II toxin-antitoxin system VapC family toxin [Desulfonatronospira sp.]
MNLFLDTHVLLWWLDDSPSLNDAERNAIADPGNLIVVSAAVIWEMRIKQALGKLVFSTDFYPVIKNQGFELLSITADHAYAAGGLPVHHRDPFDRMIIAQARLENLCIITRDSIFSRYEVSVFAP